MKGDFTRSTFKSKKHYSGVRQQQGRVQVDADFNEYVDIQTHLRHTSLGDVIGLCGGPQDNAGFKITVGTGGLLIGQGRYYVDGILCENDEQVLVSNQPDLPGQTVPAAPASGYYLAYLDVWPRHITALEDKDIREVALGGTDTATRVKTVWQVKLAPAGGVTSASTPLCSDTLFKTTWDAVVKPGNCLLTAGVATSEKDEKPCIVPARAGYKGLENQLYRVEVHEDEVGKETFKWSRENGSVVFPITFNKVEGGKSYVTLNQLGKDSVLSLGSGDWVEVLGDKTELNCQPGTMVKVLPESSIAKGTIVLSGDVSSHSGESNLKIRRWEQKDTDKVTLKNGTILIKEGVSFPLENGVSVKFEKITGATYYTGDYWLIPARTATRDIEWPRDTGTPPMPLPQPPLGIRHHFCRLAVLKYDGTVWSLVHDCRRLFPPLTEMVRFCHVAGDGQEAMPGKPLPKPLQVSVVNGQKCVENAKVRFKVVGGSGRVREYKNETDTPCLNFTSGGATSASVQTGADGIASAGWRLDSTNLSQQVEATLLEIDGKPMVETVDGEEVPFLPPLRFNANLSVAWEVKYNPQICTETNHPLADTVQDALDLLYCNAALYYVSGDGQEALPGEWLPKPLQARVANGKWPVANAKVVFTIERPGKGNLKTTGRLRKTIEVTTDANGMAVCHWQLDDENSSQQVKAYLLDTESLPLYFNAGINRSGASCCITIGVSGEYTTLKEAIVDLREKYSRTDICFCLLPDGTPHVLPEETISGLLSSSELSISIVGRGSNSPIHLEGPVQCIGTKSFSITDTEIEFKYIITGDKPGLVFKDCKSVSFNSCRVFGITDVAAGGALLSIGTTDRVSLKDNSFYARSTDSSSAIAEVVEETGDESITVPLLPVTTVVAAPMATATVNTNIMLAAANLVAMNKTARVKLGKNMITLATGASRANMSKSEAVSVTNLGMALSAATVDASTVVALLNDVQNAAVRYRPGVAVILGEGQRSVRKTLAKDTATETETATTIEADIAQDEMYIVENNEIIGVISLYGGKPLIDETEFKEFFTSFAVMLPRIPGLDLEAPADTERPAMTGVQGTLELKGNHLVGITTAKSMLDNLKKYASSGSRSWRLNIFARCILNSNVIEGLSLLVNQNLTLSTNDFPMSTVASTRSTDLILAGGSIVDSGVYVGNHGCRPGIAWLDFAFSLSAQQAANPLMQIISR